MFKNGQISKGLQRIKTPCIMLSLLLVCLLYCQETKVENPLQTSLKLNTKVVVSHFSHTCSAATITDNQEKEDRKESELAINENKVLTLGNDNDNNCIENEQYSQNATMVLLSYIQNKKNNLITCKTLQQLNVLLI